MKSNGKTTRATEPDAPPPARKIYVGALDDYIIGIIGIPLMGGGWAGLIAALIFHVCAPPSARDEGTRPFLPVTPLRALVQTPGAGSGSAGSTPFHEGALVRVEGFLRGDPPIAAPEPDGALYALQYLEVTHKVPDGREDSVGTYDVTDDRQSYQPRLWLDEGAGQAGEGSVEVCVPEKWEGYRFHAHPLSGEVDLPAAVPAGVSRALALHSVPPQRWQEWTLWAIPQHTRVTVLALPRWRDGHRVLALDTDHWCAVSPDSWEDINDGIWVFIPPWIYLCVFGSLALLPVPWHYWKKLRNRWFT